MDILFILKTKVDVNAPVRLNVNQFDGSLKFLQNIDKTTILKTMFAEINIRTEKFTCEFYQK